MTGIEKRIKALEERTGLDRPEIRIVKVINCIDGNSECPGFHNNKSCIRYQEFLEKPRLNENGYAIFWLDCKGCVEC